VVLDVNRVSAIVMLLHHLDACRLPQRHHHPHQLLHRPLQARRLYQLLNRRSRQLRALLQPRLSYPLAQDLRYVSLLVSLVRLEILAALAPVTHRVSRSTLSVATLVVDTAISIILKVVAAALACITTMALILMGAAYNIIPCLRGCRVTIRRGTSPAYEPSMLSSKRRQQQSKPHDPCRSPPISSPLPLLPMISEITESRRS
jgi:hypothetical protein